MFPGELKPLPTPPLTVRGLGTPVTGPGVGTGSGAPEPESELLSPVPRTESMQVDRRAPDPGEYDSSLPSVPRVQPQPPVKPSLPAEEVQRSSLFVVAKPREESEVQG